jgi:hypothetical protein
MGLLMNYRYLLGVTEENHIKYEATGCPAKFRTGHLPITNLEIYRYDILLGAFKCEIIADGSYQNFGFHE